MFARVEIGFEKDRFKANMLGVSLTGIGKRLPNRSDLETQDRVQTLTNIPCPTPDRPDLLFIDSVMYTYVI